MSNQFYEYLSNKLIDFFENEGIIEGSRFFMLFENKDQLLKFCNSLKEIAKENSIYSKFLFEHPISHEKYNTYSLNINGKKLVIANSSNATNSFLVTLRNCVKDQEDDFKGSALLILYHDPKDSIEYGARDLQKEGMPFSIENITKNLDNDINNSKKISVSSKQIIKFFLSKQINDFYENTLWDYETILSIIKKGHIDSEDMETMGLFVDDELENIKSMQKINRRLTDNFNVFNKILSYSHLDDVSKENELKKMFRDDMVKTLMDGDWKQTKWSDVQFDLEKFKEEKHPLQIEEVSSKNKLPFWDKPDSNTAAGRRKRNIIIFNNKNLDKVSLDFKFDRDGLDRKFFKEGARDCKISKQFIKLRFDVSSSTPTFKKIIYSHENETKSTFEFNIVVLNAEEEIFNSIKTRYFVNIKEKFIKIVNDSDDDIIFGNEVNETEEKIIDEKEQKVPLGEEYSIVISEESHLWNEDYLSFILQYNNNDIRFLIEEKSAEKRGLKKSSTIWNLKRKNKENFTFDGTKAFQDTNVFYLEEKFKDYLEFERQIIENEIFYAKVREDGSLEKVEISFSEDLENAYLDILNYYKNFDDSPQDNLPSLFYLNDDLKVLYKKFIDIFNQEIDDIEGGVHLSDLKNKKDLIRLGRVDAKDTIMYSPLSPLNIAYQLEIMEQCGNEELYSNMLKRLVPNNLVPYIYPDEDDSLFTPTFQKDAHEWLIYRNIDKVSISATNVYISKLVSEKLNEFVKHFDYLFDTNSSAPMKINLINLKDDKYVVSGVFKFIRDRLSDKSNGKPIPLEIHIYNDTGKSSFDDLFKFNSKSQIENEFDVKIKSDDLDEMDIIHSVQDNIRYFIHPYKETHEIDFVYSHISFYKVEAYTSTSQNVINEIESGLSLNGLLSSVNSKIKHSNYRTGYGIKNVFNEEDLLVKTSKNINEIAFNSRNKGRDAYSKDRVIGTNIELKGDNIEKLYEKSHWVTFIEPSFGVEYFDSSDDNLIIIHYSDQYSSSTKYDTITVTNRDTQYMDVIENFLDSQNAFYSPNNIPNIIKLFNCINGEWLLQLIYKDINFTREKLSIISAIKYCLSILNHEDIFWIPISLSEILRIAGNVGLSRNDGIFGDRLKGKHSDDLLFIGLKFDKNAPINVFFYPIEVKIGQPDLEKAKEQLDNTYKDLKREIRKINNFGFEFRNKFMRNFFIQLLLSNEEKFVSNHIWDDKDLVKIEEFKPQLLNDDFNISYALEEFIGKGAIIYFEKFTSKDTLELNSNRYMIKIQEEKAWSALDKSIKEVCREVHTSGSDFSAYDLLEDLDLTKVDFILGVNEEEIDDYVDSSSDDEDFDSSVDDLVSSVTYDEEDVDDSDEIIEFSTNSNDFEYVDEYAVNIFDQFIDENQGKYISEDEEKFIVSRIIRGERKIFGKFMRLEYAQDYEYKLMINSWDDSFKTKKISPYGKFIHKNDDKFVIERKIKGELKTFGIFDTIEEAIKLREDLIDDNWGVEGEIVLIKEGAYGKYIRFLNGVYKIEKTIDGELLSFGLFDTLDEAILARNILIENAWVDDNQVPETLYSWRHFTSYNPLLDGWEVSNLIETDLLSFGIFNTTADAKLAIKILIENEWDASCIPFYLYHKNSNIRMFKRAKGNVYVVIRRINDDFIRYGTFNTYEDALNRRNELLLTNWIIEEEEEKIEEFIYYNKGRYFVKNEIDGEMRIFGIFDELEDAVDFRLKCIKAKWDLQFFEEGDVDHYDSEDDELEKYIDDELDSDIFSMKKYLVDYDFVNE